MNIGRAERLLGMLDEVEFTTAQDLADALGCSEKTVRTSLHELDDMLKRHGASLESKPRCGYRLHVENRDAFGTLVFRSLSSGLPDTAEQRVDYLILGMLFLMDYAKAQDLCDVLFISTSTLSASIKAVEEIVGEYRIAVERRPNHGMRLVGQELDIRRLLIDRYMSRDELPREFGEDARQQLDMMVSTVKGLLAQHGVKLSEFAFQSFVNYAYIARLRVLTGFPLPCGDYDEIEIEPSERAVACGLIEQLKISHFTDHVASEERYLELYLAGKRIVGSVAENDANFVITEKADRITVEILSLISHDFDIDLLNNFDLRMSLNQHLAPMDIRLRYGMELVNPLLDQVKENYPLAFQMAKLAGGVLARYYKCEIPEDELGYIALILQLGVEKWRIEHKRRILIVCGSGKSSARLLRYRFEQKFKDSLEAIYTCDSMDLDAFDFDKVDFIFSTDPIAISVPKPIVEVGQFLDGSDISKVDRILRAGSSQGICERFIGPWRFIAPGELACDTPGITKDQVLRELCDRICSSEATCPTFYDMVLEREQAIQMRLSNGVALPHPNGIASSETFAYVVVFAHEVLWNGEPARMAVLVSMGSDDEADDSRSLLSEAIARFVLDDVAVAAMLQEPSYDLFQNLIEG